MAVQWGATQAATQLTTISDTLQYFDETPQLAANEIAHVDIECNFNGTTDNLEVNVYATLDDSTENWDDVPIMSFELDSGVSIDPMKKSFTVGLGVYKFRIGVQSTGTTDDHTSADMEYRIATLS